MTERITFIELDLRRCANTYSESPCTAALGITGTKKCFNSFGTCQDKPNFVDETVVARYSTATSQPPNIDAIPNIASVSIRPAKLELGESIGIRASINITFMDSRYPDTGPEGDRYLADRDYDPFTQGTYWGKFRARFPFVRGSNIRLIRGSTDQSLAQMETRHFIVDAVAGPNSDGSFTITCKDILNLAKGKQAQAPVLSDDELALDLLSGNTVMEPVGNQFNYDIGDYYNVGGGEIVRVVAHIAATNKLGIERGAFNTPDIDHEAKERLQLCVVYDAQPVNLIISDLLQEYAGIDSSFIPLLDWAIEEKDYIDRPYSAVISEPTDVDKLINELLVQTASTIWWDDIAQLIKFRVLRAVDSGAATYSDDIIKKNTISIKDQPSKRVSQVWTYFAQINPLEKLDDVKNYASTVVTTSPESEDNFNGEKSIKKIFSRWIPIGSDAGGLLNALILSRYTTPPRLVSYSLQRSNQLITPELGGGYNFESWILQNDEGGGITMPLQILQVKSIDTGFMVIGEEVLYSQTIAPVDPSIKNIPIDNDTNNINLFDFASTAQNIGPNDTVNFTIAQSATIGSDSTSTPSIISGVGWPANVTINILNNGRVIGKGGAGGAGGGVLGADAGDTKDGASGAAGGDAFSFTVDVTLTNSPTGVIGGGGGGAGGGGGIYIIGLGAFVTGSGAGGGIGGLIGAFGGVKGATTLGLTELSALGNDGAAGNKLLEGVGGEAVFITLPSAIGSISGGGGGDGGALGADGADGTPAQNGTAFGSRIGTEGAGGAGGSAINKNGNTITIINNGTIAGLINP